MTNHTMPDPAAESMWFLRSVVKIPVSHKSGTDGISVIEHRLSYADSPPLHIHRDQDEVFHLIEGVMRFRVGNRDIIAKPGDTLLAPKGVPHTYRVESSTGARCLTVTTGPGFETMVREMSSRQPLTQLQPFGEVTPELAERLTEVCARNGIDIIGPPLA